MCDFKEVPCPEPDEIGWIKIEIDGMDVILEYGAEEPQEFEPTSGYCDWERLPEYLLAIAQACVSAAYGQKYVYGPLSKEAMMEKYPPEVD